MRGREGAAAKGRKLQLVTCDAPSCRPAARTRVPAVQSPQRILFATPAYWPAHAFGGPVVVARELVSRLVARGHDVEVVTTTLRDVGERPSRTTTKETVDGAKVTYLGTPLRYRWMGVTPTLPLALRR